QGQFRFNGVSLGQHDISVDRPGWVISDSGGLVERVSTPLIDPQHSPMAIRLVKLPAIGGTVRDAIGTAAKGAWVSVVAADQSFSRAVQADDRGTYRIWGLRPGAYNGDELKVDGRPLFPFPNGDL